MNEKQGLSVLSSAVRRDSYRGADSEDRAEIFSSTDSSILLVADGVGGQAGGARAASLLLELVQGVVPEITRLDAPAWARFLIQTDLIIHGDVESGETTAVVAQVSNDGAKIVGASVGDSEAWFVTAEGIFDLTETQRKKPFLGSGRAQATPFTLSVPASGGTLLVASDGLFKYAAHERILEAVRLPNVEEGAAALIDAARLSSGSFSDDISVLLCRIPAGNRKQSLWERIITR